MTTTKPGIKSTEFWISTAIVIGGVVACVYSESELAKVVGMVCATLTTAGYSFSRASVKKSANGHK